MTARFSWNEQDTRGHRPRLQKTAGPKFEHSIVGQQAAKAVERDPNEPFAPIRAFLIVEFVNRVSRAPRMLLPRQLAAQNRSTGRKERHHVFSMT